MGIRIRKRLGYGYASPSGDESDGSVLSIVNMDSFLLKETALPFESTQEAWEDFRAFADQWSKQREEAGSRTILLDPWWVKDRINASQRLPFVGSSVERNLNEEEVGENDVIMVTPLGMEDRWYRFDDMIDYIEEQKILRKETMEDEVHVFHDGIYPFNGSYIRADTLEPLDDIIMFWVQARNNPNSKPQHLDEMAQLANFDSHEHAQSLVIPKPADDAVALALWGKLFVDDSYAYRMRPMYYKYWR